MFTKILKNISLALSLVAVAAVVSGCGGSGGGASGGVAIPTSFQITGTAKDTSENLLPGVAMSLSGSGTATQNTTTNSSGVYTFSNVSSTSTYQITLTATSGTYTFAASPLTYNVVIANPNQIQNFVGYVTQSVQ